VPSGPCLCGLCFLAGPPQSRFCVIVIPPIGPHNERVCFAHHFAMGRLYPLGPTFNLFLSSASTLFRILA
jgi:hypothetical protein